jgi:hydroxypyruvate isomerase
MRRRDFLRTALAASAATTLSPTPAAARPAAGRPRAPRTFGLRYAPHFGMFRAHTGDDLVAQLEFFRAEGFTAIEDNEMRTRSAAEQERVGRTLARLGMRMGVFVAHTIDWREPTLTSGDPTARDRFLAEVRSSVDVAARTGARWMTVVPGHVHPRLHPELQTANVIDALKRASAILEPRGLVLVIEPLNTLRDHPGMFLTRIPQAYMICRAVGSPSCKVLFDLYHQQITEGNLLPNAEAAWSEIAYFQVGDNPGRKEPGTGEMNYRNIFAFLKARRYDGIVGMEHGNSRPGREGERAVIDAYVGADASTR